MNTPPPAPPTSGLRRIRRGLIKLLGQLFLISVAVSMLLLFLLVGFLIHTEMRNNNGFGDVLLAPLTFYYLGNDNSWNGIADALTADNLPASLIDSAETGIESLILVDDNDRIVLAYPDSLGLTLGDPYTPAFTDRRLPIIVTGQPVGVAYAQLQLITPAEAISTITLPLLFFATTATILVTVLGILLWRRLLEPIAAVMAASNAVATGDLSARVALKGPRDLQPLIDGFNHMAATLQTNDTQRRETLADVAHELRTPLSVIRGRLEGIVDGIYPPTDAAIAPVLEETYVLEKLVDDLRLLALAESRALNLEHRPVALDALLTRAVDLFAAEADDAGITLCLAPPPTPLPTVLGDEQRLSQVVGNLVSNALRYCQPGNTVTLSLTPADSGLTLTIADDGPGLPDAELDHLFDRFWRAEPSRSRTTGGAGLGLAIARQLVLAHHGQITAEPTPDTGGLTIHVWLPTQN